MKHYRPLIVTVAIVYSQLGCVGRPFPKTVEVTSIHFKPPAISVGQVVVLKRPVYLDTTGKLCRAVVPTACDVYALRAAESEFGDARKAPFDFILQFNHPGGAPIDNEKSRDPENFLPLLDQVNAVASSIDAALPEGTRLEIKRIYSTNVGTNTSLTYIAQSNSSASVHREIDVTGLTNLGLWGYVVNGGYGPNPFVIEVSEP